MNAAYTADSGDPAHGRVLVLSPNGDAHVLVRNSGAWGGVRMEGDLLIPTAVNNYLGFIYDFHSDGQRMDFGDIYLKGNGSYLQVNPHRDYNVGRTLYPEYHIDLTGKDAITIGTWTHFMFEVMGSQCHVYIGDMTIPKLTFGDLELDSGAIGLQPRSVGGDVWVDNVQVWSIEHFAYQGPPVPEPMTYEPRALLTDWEVYGPLDRTDDQAARDSPTRAWRPFVTDARGAVVTGRIVDTHGPRTVAYFRTRIESDTPGPAILQLSSVDDLALWVNGRFHWFIPRLTRAWPDFWSNPEHQGRSIPIDLKAGDNEIVLRVRGGVYASGGFFARLKRRTESP